MNETARLATADDWPLIQQFHQQQNEEQGTNTALPQLFDESGSLARNIALAFIVERDGIPISSFYCELVPELCFAGTDPGATATARRAADQISFLLRSLGFTGWRCVVPEHMNQHIARPLEHAGFKPDEGLVHHFKDLRGKEHV